MPDCGKFDFTSKVAFRIKLIYIVFVILLNVSKEFNFRSKVAALETKNEWLPDMIKTCNQNQKLIKNAVEKVPGACLPVYPSAATMMVIDIEKTGINGNDIQNELLYQHQIFVRAGDYVSTTFGEKFIRVSFSIPTNDVKRFNKHFPEVMKKLSK